MSTSKAVVKGRAVGTVQRNPAEDLKNILEPVMTASLLTGENALVIGDVGMGKSEIFFYAACQFLGADGTLLIDCTPSTPESKIKGYANPALYIDPSLIDKGAPEYIVKDTPLDPKKKVVILDEWQRLSELGQHALVGVMHNLQVSRPIFWATSNWPKQDMLTQAVRDRFGITVMYDNPKMDVEAIMKMPPISEWKFNIPSAKEVAEIRDMSTRPVPDKSFKAIAEMLTEINRLITTESNGIRFTLNNRRIRQWQNIMLATSYYEFGKAEFSELSKIGLEVLRYAYPVINAQEAIEWRRIISKVGDIVGTAIAEFEANAYVQWQMIVKENNGKRSQSSKEDLIQRLGAVLADAQEQLEKNWPDDPRAIKASDNMNEWYRKVCRGESL